MSVMPGCVPLPRLPRPPPAARLPDWSLPLLPWRASRSARAVECSCVVTDTHPRTPHRAAVSAAAAAAVWGVCAPRVRGVLDDRQRARRRNACVGHFFCTKAHTPTSRLGPLTRAHSLNSLTQVADPMARRPRRSQDHSELLTRNRAPEKQGMHKDPCGRFKCMGSDNSGVLAQPSLLRPSCGPGH